LSVERYTLADTPANRFVPLQARTLAYPPGRPGRGLQLVPLSVERYAPPEPAPTKQFVALTANVTGKLFVSPVFIAVQLEPLFVERNTPPPYVPAKRSDPLAVIERTSVFVRPVLDSVQCAPLFVET
jgi:hypothetical protein